MQNEKQLLNLLIDNGAAIQNDLDDGALLASLGVDNHSALVGLPEKCSEKP